ncbi:MAG TPA: TraB/GumN family protein, partial [Mucilaginibacter sp.]
MTKPYSLNILNLNAFARILKSAAKLSLLTILLLMTVTPILKAQQKPVYNILWRIEGKGLTKPSYLFGTMHVKDNRAFRFSDSVMLAIQSCQAFSLEVHPDTIIKRMFTTLSEHDSSRSLKKWLSDADYERLAKRFEKKNGYPMGNLDPIRVESMMKPEKKKTTDKKSFVDAYLYGIARSMGKNTYGLENANQQFDDHYGEKSDIKERLEGLIDDTYDEEILDKQEEMTAVYSSGNLESIVNYLGKDQLEAEDIIPRNHVMLNSIIRIIHDQSLFAAVGVAHLPGDNGLISLLRKEGYTVQAVKANFTGIADKYNTDYSKLPWKTYTDEESGYSLELPFTPMKTTILYSMPTIIYPDIANDIYFGAYAIQKGTALKPVSEDEVMRKALNNFVSNKQSKLISKKTVVANGLKCTDITMDKDGQIIRCRLIASNNFLYCLYAGNDPQSVNSDYANRFFNSFKTFKIAPRANPAWVTFKNDTAAFTAHLPGKPQLIVRDIPMANKPGSEPFRIKIYLALDSSNLQTYLIRYSDYPIKSYLADKQTAFDAIIKEFSSKGKLLGKVQNISKDGYDGREAGILLADEYKCTVQIFARGNRVYILMKQRASGDETSINNDDFFSSFKFTPYQKATLIPLKIDNGSHTCMVFEHNQTTVDSVKRHQSFYDMVSSTFSKNMASGGSYVMEHTVISKYYRAENIDSLYSFLSRKLISYTDSLIRTDTVVANGIKGRQVISQNKYTHNKNRVAFFIDNADIFYFSGHVADEELFDETNNAFYTSLKKDRQTPTFDLTSSKSKLILNDLTSTDTTTYKAALGALSYYEFENSDLPDIYKTLERTYADDTTATGVRAM